MRMEFLIFNWDDIEKYLTVRQKRQLHVISQTIMEGREADGKPASNTYLVVNIDEPYAQEVADAISRHEGEEIILPKPNMV